MTWFAKAPKTVIFDENQTNLLVSRFAHETLNIETRMAATFEKEFKQLKTSIAQYIAEVIKLKRQLATSNELVAKRDEEYQALLRQHLELALRYAPAIDRSIAPPPKPHQQQKDEHNIRSYMSMFEDLPPGHEEGYSNDELMLVSESKEQGDVDGKIQEDSE